MLHKNVAGTCCIAGGVAWGVDTSHGACGASSMGRVHEHDDARITAIALRAGKGDRAALTEFIRATQGDVWRLLAHLADTDRADDLTQETYLRVMSALPRFAGRSSARTWLLSVARRVWVDSVRHDMARPRSASSEWEVAADQHTASIQSSQSAWTDWVDVQLLMENLDPDRREALILTQVLGYTYDEAAAIVGVRVGTIRSRVARARADLVAASQSGESAASGAGSSARSSVAPESAGSAAGVATGTDGRAGASGAPAAGARVESGRRRLRVLR